MKRSQTIILLLFLLQLQFTQAQTGCPNIFAGNDTTICSPKSAILHASIVSTGATNSYSVSSIPYAPPYAFNTGTPINVAIDDRWSTLITLPFNFCYYGILYNHIVAGSNGVITFDVTKASPTIPLTSTCPWEFSVNCPSSLLPKNSIFGVYHDIDPSVSGNMYSAILGTYPCRTYVISWNQVAMFSCTSLIATHQIVLYESTNIIDVYIQNKPLCPTWNYGGSAIVGIQDSTGTVGLAAPGRNTTPSWTATNEAWRFTPNGAPNYLFTWYSGSSVISYGPTVTVTPSTTKTYTSEVMFQLCDGNFLTLSDSVVVNVTPKPIVTVTADTICIGDTATITAAGANTYLWAPPINLTTATLKLSPTLTTNYSVVGTTLGCKDTANTFIKVNPQPLVSVNNPSICPKDTATLKANGAHTYVWNYGIISDSIRVSPDHDTTYLVVGTDINNCVDTATASVHLYPLPTIQLTPNTTICMGSQATLTAGGGVSYSWNTNPPETSSSITVSPIADTTIYTVGVTDNNNCFDSASVVVCTLPIPLPTISIEMDTICKGTYTTITASGGNTYLWNTGEITPSISVKPLSSSIYSVTVSTTLNNVVCSKDTSIKQNVRNCNVIYVPNSFMPTGYNTVFKPIGDIAITKTYQFAIYNRWGQMVFETTDVNQGWDGRFNGEYVQTGAYIYYLKIDNGYEEPFEKIGTVTVVN